MRSTRQLVSAVVIGLMLFVALNVAHSEGSETTPELETGQERTFAKAIQKDPPKYPRRAARRGQEGWVIVSYVITDEGRVIDPIVEESNGIPAFEKEALRIVQTWEYEPATINGFPVEQCHTRHRLTFDMRGPAGATDYFVKHYRRINRMITEERLQDADEALAKLKEMRGMNLYEEARITMLEAVVAEGLGERDRHIVAMRNAIHFGRDIEVPSTQRSLVASLFAVLVNEGRYGEALEVFADLQGIEDADELSNWAELSGAAARIADLLSGPNPVSVPAVLRSFANSNGGDEPPKGYWSYKPTRRAVAFDEIDGTLDEFEIRCDWKRFVDSPDAERTWTIPESWGDCRVIVSGSPGTSFKLLELPTES